MRRVTGDVVGGVTAVIMATAAFVLWREQGVPWASSLPGHLLGVLGIALMLWSGFGYTWRKRRPSPGGVAMRVAMRSHMVAGLVGPYLVVLHSGLAFRGLAGALTLLMVIVVASGVVGKAVVSAMPSQIALADPVRVAMLDAEMARLEALAADLAREHPADLGRRDAVQVETVTVRHEQELQRTRWQPHGAGLGVRRALSVWWYLHIPVSAALWVLAAAHIVGALYYATLSR